MTPRHHQQRAFDPWRSACALLAGCLLSTAAAAEGLQVTEPQPDHAASEPAGRGFTVNGFGTLGLAHTEVGQPWQFIRDKTQLSQDGSLKTLLDTRVGLQVNWQLSPTLETVAQTVWKRMDRASASDDYLDWAFLAWRPTPEWTVRVGRTSPDAFLLSDHRNVGFAYPWVRPSVAFYGWWPIFNQDGIDVRRQWQHGNSTWIGKLSFGQSSSVIAHDALSSATDFHLKDIMLGTLSHEADGLVVKASWARGRFNADNPDLTRLQAGLQAIESATAQVAPPIAMQASSLARKVADINAKSMVIEYVALGASYSDGPWQLHGELSRVSGKINVLKGWRGYVSAGYRFDRTTLFTGVGWDAPKEKGTETPDWSALGPQAQEAGAQGARIANYFRCEQRTFTLGLRYDTSPRTAVKLQWDHIRVAPNGSGSWAAGGPQPARANVLTATFDFVF